MLLTSWWLADTFIFIIATIFLLYKYSTRNFDHWKKRGVPFAKPLPILGNAKDVIFFKKSMGDWMKELYDTTEGQYRGFFILDEPVLLVTCPHLVKRIMVQDFNYFVDRTVALPKHNRLLVNTLFFQRGAEWKALRTRVTPVFTSGKIKAMYPLVQHIGENLVQYIAKNKMVYDIKEVCAKYATDIICKCAFGIDAHCLEDENATFRKLTRAMSDFTIRNGVCQLSYWLKEHWVYAFKLDFFAPWVLDYFEKAFWDTMNMRKTLKFRVNDLIDFLTDMMDTKTSSPMDAGQVVSQATQFFMAGFDTTAITISFTLYELAVYPDIQDKLRSEIIDVIESEGSITYDGLKKMKYLDLCVMETLRKYPVLPYYDRRCSEDYKVPGSDFVIEKGTSVYVPVYGLQLDENFFPDPYKYKPERFLENINKNINGLAYLPFGEGPRSCIGERFAQVTTKAALVYILSKFEVEKCPATPVPIEFEPKSFTFQSKVGIPLSFKELQHT